jgi:hypothetical protein
MTVLSCAVLCLQLKSVVGKLYIYYKKQTIYITVLDTLFILFFKKRSRISTDWKQDLVLSNKLKPSHILVESNAS